MSDRTSAADSGHIRTVVGEGRPGTEKRRYSDREIALMLPIVYRDGTKTPILVAGLPRTGTTWIASVLGATAGTTYFHEPFNYRNVKESAPFTMRYLRSDDDDPKFAAYAKSASLDASGIGR